MCACDKCLTAATRIACIQVCGVQVAMRPDAEHRIARLPRWLVCARCGDTVGVHEPMWFEHRDGTIRSSSLLNIRAAERRLAHRVFHAGCIVPDYPPL
jgi:hypothetical protein